MANEPGTAQVILKHNGNVFVVDNFPADKYDELKLFAQTLTQPAVVPNMIPQPPPFSGFNSMANEPGPAQPTLQHNNENLFVLADFPADKFDELMLFAQTLTQPAVVPNMIPQPAVVPNMIPRPPPSSSTQIVRQPAIIDYYSEQSTFGANRRASLSRFIQKRKDRVTAKPPQ